MGLSTTGVLLGSALGMDRPRLLVVSLLALILYITIVMMIGGGGPLFMILICGPPVLINLFGVAWTVGSRGGAILGGGIADTIYYPRDNRKPEKEYSIIKSHIQLGKYEEAIEEYKKELEENPGDVQVLWDIAAIYAYNLKKYDNAEEFLEKIISNEKTINRKMWMMAVFRATEILTKNLDNKQQARQLLNRLIERYPDSKGSMMAQIRLFGKRIDGAQLDRYYEIRIGEDTYSEVNQRLLEKWISRSQVNKLTLVMNTETGRWDQLRDLEEFKPFWPPAPTANNGHVSS